MSEELNTVDGTITSTGVNKTINVLTILTFIGSAIQLLSGLYTYFTIDKSVAEMKNNAGAVADALGDGKMAEMMDGAMKVLEKTQENKTLIVLVTVLGAAACIYGALQMRKGKLQGLWTYLGGEWAPVIVNLAIIGMGAFGGMQLVSLVFPIIFTALYWMNKKHLA